MLDYSGFPLETFPYRKNSAPRNFPLSFSKNNALTRRPILHYWQRSPFRVLALFCLAGIVHAQQPTPSGDHENPADGNQPGYTLKVNSQIVQLDVVVRNAKGDLVRGLHAGDFTVTEDASPQQIVSFEEALPAPPDSRGQSQIDSTAELDHREPDAPVTIIVLDEVTAKFEDQYFARYAMEKYLSKQGEVLDQPMTLIARTIDRTMVLSDYTTSKKKILDALNRHFGANDWRSNNANFNDFQTSAAFASLLEVAKATQGHPGHKNLVWIGRGFPTMQWDQLKPDQTDELKAAVSKCVELLRQSRVTLYVIDPAGVQGLSGTLDENSVTSLEDPFDQSVSFDSLARATGGASMHGRNDVDQLIGDAVANGESFYTLAYRPSTPTAVDPTKFRTIKVTLKDSSLIASNREGYYPGSEQPAVAPFADAKGNLAGNTLFELASASTGLMVFDGVPLTLSRQGPSTNELLISFPASAIGLEPSDGKLKADVTLIALSFDRKGKVLTKDGRVVSLHLAELSDGQSENRTIHLTTALNPDLPIARLRIVIRSNSNGKTGAENFFLTSPSTLKDPATGLKAR
jgi:VWFA-related protein